VARRVSVEFVAELAGFRRGMREGADDVRRLKDESKAAQVEVGRLGVESKKAADEVTRGTSAQLRNAKGQFSAAGAEGGRAWGDGFTRDAEGRLRDSRGRFVAEGRNLGESAASGVSGGLSGINPRVFGLLAAGAGIAVASLQAVPPVLTAIGGGLGAIPGLAAGAVGAIGTLSLGLAGVGDAIDKVFKPPTGADPYDALSRNAKKFVDEIKRLKPELVGVQQLAQNHVFAGLDRELKETATVALPFATKQVVRFGDTWNATAKELFKVGRDPAFLSGLDSALGASDRFFDKVNTRIGPTSKALSQLFIGSTPFVDKFGDSLLSYVDDFNSWIDQASQSGDLEAFFKDAATQASALLDIGKEVFVLIGRIGGMQQGSTLLQDMADALERFNNSAQGTRDIAGIIETGNAAIKGVVDVLLILGEALSKTLADPGTRDAVVLFFDVLRTGAEIIAGLVDLFGLLPDGVQSVVLAGIALALVWGKLQAVGDLLGGAVEKATGKLDKMGPAGEKAGRGLSKAADYAGKAATAFVLLTAADAVFKSFTDDSADADKLTASLADLTGACLTQGEVMRVFGGDVARLDGGLQGLQGAVKLTGSGVADFSRGLLENIPLLGSLADKVIDKTLGQSFLSAAEDLKALDQALVNSVSTGGVAYAEQQLQALADQAGISIEELKARLPEYAAAVDAAGKNTGYYARNALDAELRQKILNGSMEDGIAAAGGLARAMAILNGETLDARQAESDYQAAVDDLTNTVKEYAGQISGVNELLSLQTEESRAVDGQMRRLWDTTTGIADATYASTKAKYGEAVAQQVVSDSYGRAREALIQQATAILGSRTAAERYVDQIYKVPKEWTTALKLDGNSSATSAANIEAYKRLIRSIPPEVYTRLVAEADQGFGRRASGGSVRAGNAYLVGEEGPEVVTFGDNGWVHNAHDTAAMMTTGQRAMAWQGMGVSPKAASAQAVYGTAASTQAVVDYDRLAAAVSNLGIQARVFVGDRELTDVVVEVVSNRDRGLVRSAHAGAGRAAGR
jgi:hypothetical protein